MRSVLQGPPEEGDGLGPGAGGVGGEAGAGGAVGDFLYKRIAGIEAMEPGYRKFIVKPLVGGGITWAKGSVETPFGTIVSDWKIENNTFKLQICVPCGTNCVVSLPDGTTHTYGSGTYKCECEMK